MKVGDIIQYYAYKILDVYCKVSHIGQIKREAPAHLPENWYNWKTNSGMNAKVGGIIQYYAYKRLDVLD